MKNNRNPLYSAVHYALAAGVVSTLGASALAYAQDEDVAELERVEVTGSRIKRTDIEGPNPVFVMQREDIEATGMANIGDILQNLPIAGSALNTNFNNGGDGSIQLDLRNLGSNRVLVLVNGRRWVTIPTISAVDLQTIPTSIIERIEVLKDGASAIYGSDAIAGVVNIITRKDFTGAQANYEFGRWDDNDGDTTNADFSIGNTSDRTQVFMNAYYVKQEPIFAADREISKEPSFGTGTNFGSSGTPEGRVLFVDPNSGATRDLTFDSGQTFPNGAPESAYRPFTGPDHYNFAPDNYLRQPSQRWGIYANGSYQITDNISFFSDVLYNHRQSDQLLAATPLFAGVIFNGVADLYVAADQPFNPFGFTLGLAGGGTPWGFGRRMLEAGNRDFAQSVDTYQFTGGFQGNFELADRYWDWETYFQYARSDDDTITHGLLNLNRIQTALDPALCDNDPACVPLNLFGGAGGTIARDVVANGTGTITPAMIDYITFTAQDHFQSKRTLYEANVTGTLADLPAGPLGMAVGYEYRRESGFDQPDALIALGATSGNVRQPTAGGFSVDEGYVEFNIPILSDLPAVQILELNLASRYSDYSNFGTTINSKAGVRWQPTSDILIRGTWSEGFRAPNISELFRGQSDNFPPFTDPCSDMLATQGQRDNPQPQNIIDNCIADGVPANGSYQQANAQIRVTVGGNPNVGPETSTSRTFGVVWSPGFIDGLDVTLDYYDISLDNTITSLAPSTVFNGCYDAENQNLCSLITRGQGGAVADALLASTNIGGTDTSGIDFNVNYSFPETPVGFFKVNWDSTYLEKYTDHLPTSTGGLQDVTREGLEFGDFNLPRWKSNLYLDWSYGDWSAVYDMRYIHGTDEVCPTGFPNIAAFGLCSGPIDESDSGFDPDFGPVNHLGATLYHDAQVSYHYTPWDTRFTLGARNLFDKDPPLCFQCFANSYDPTTYDVPGRFWYLRVTTNF